MKLFETVEGYINILQNSHLSWEITLIRLENKLEEIRIKYDLEEAFLNTDFYNEQGFDVFVIGLKDVEVSNAYEEFILFLSSYFKIDVESLKKLDYLNLRKFWKMFVNNFKVSVYTNILLKKQNIKIKFERLRKILKERDIQTHSNQHITHIII